MGYVQITFLATSECLLMIALSTSSDTVRVWLIDLKFRFVDCYFKVLEMSKRILMMKTRERDELRIRQSTKLNSRNRACLTFLVDCIGIGLISKSNTENNTDDKPKTSNSKTIVNEFVDVEIIF